MEEFIPIALAITIIIKFIDTFRYATAKDWRQVGTQVFVWFIAILVILLLAATDFADTVGVGDYTLAELNAWSIVFWALGIGSGASFGVDIKKAIDGSDSAKVPPMGGPTS